MEKINLSIIIPIHNSQSNLQILWESLVNSSLLYLSDEVIFVNDASTDNTLIVLEKIQKTDTTRKVKILNLDKNLGRFAARMAGANIASGKILYFIDSRVTVPADHGTVLKELLKQSTCIMADARINNEINKYSLYWNRTHEKIFAKALELRKVPLYINKENFHKNLTGTTAFIVAKEIFIRHANSFNSAKVLNDDNPLLEKIAGDTPIYFNPNFYVFWEPRTTFTPFMLRMFERGPSFVEFHIFNQRGTFFYVVLSVLVFYTLLIYASFSNWIIFLIAVTGSIVLGLLSTALFAKSPEEFIKLMPIHISTLISFGIGILWGILVNLNPFSKKGY